MSKIQLSLYQNGIDSIKHAIEHYAEDPVEERRYKYAILHLTQGVLLLLKERLGREHSNFIFINVATDPTTDKIKTIDTEGLILRLKKIAQVDLESQQHDRLIRQLTAKRNFVEHYAIDISQQEADSIIVQTIQFLQWFVDEELSHDFKETLGEDTWTTLLQIKEYHTAEVTRAKQEISDQRLEAMFCPTCADHTAVKVDNVAKPERWKINLLHARCLVCQTDVPGVACLQCGQGIALSIGQIPQHYSYCEACQEWARSKFGEVEVRSNNYRYVAEVYRWFQEHDTISTSQLMGLLSNVFLAGSSGPEYPTSLYHSGVIDFKNRLQKEDFEQKRGARGDGGIVTGDEYIFEWSFDSSDE